MASELTAKLYEVINEQDQPREIKHWHASSIAKCPRALYYERLGVPTLNEPGGGKKLRWRGGHAVESAIRPTLETIYPNLLTNIRFTNEELDLTGEFDGYDPDSKSLISVKSTHDFAFTSVDGKMYLKEKKGMKQGRNGREVTDWGRKENPYTHHEWQEASYVLLMNCESITKIDSPQYTKDELPAPANWPVENIIYVYITLGGLIDTFRTPVKPEIVKRVQDKLQYLTACYRDSTLPICLCQPGKEMYDVTDQYCNYKTDNDCCSPQLIERLKK